MIKPYGKRLLVKLIEVENKSPGGLLILPKDKSEEVKIAEVISVGDELKGIPVGSRVVVSKYVGLKVNEYFLVDEKDILAVEV